MMHMHHCNATLEGTRAAYMTNRRARESKGQWNEESGFRLAYYIHTFTAVCVYCEIYKDFLYGQNTRWASFAKM